MKFAYPYLYVTFSKQTYIFLYAKAHFRHSTLVEISSELVEISSKLVEISSELVEISSELVKTISEPISREKELKK